jgi:hypothetical protein
MLNAGVQMVTAHEFDVAKVNVLGKDSVKVLFHGMFPMQLTQVEVLTGDWFCIFVFTA